MSEYLDLLETNNKIKVLEPFKGAKAKHKMQCLVCNHEWEATPISKHQTFKKYGVGGCPVCNQDRRDERYGVSRNKNLQFLYDKNLIILNGYDGKNSINDKDGNHIIVKVRNTVCNHEFEALAQNLLLTNMTCSVCGTNERTQQLNDRSREQSLIWQETATEWELYKSEVSKLSESVYNKNKEIINPKNLPRGIAGSDEAYHLDHIVTRRFCFENNIPAEVCADVSNLQMKYWKDNVSNNDNLKGILPPLFSQYINGYERTQQQISQLKSIFPKAKVYHTIDDTCVSIYDETSNRAIVILPVSKIYANQKTATIIRNTLMKNDVQFSIIFEDEFDNFDLLKHKLYHYANNNTTQRLHARECEIKLIPAVLKTSFLNKYHMQGNDNCNISYGAFYNSELVAVMTFVKPRAVLGQNKKKKNLDNIWELSRFATDYKYRIPGIASKLLSKFKTDNVEWKEIYSYADLRWSVGNLYAQLNFIKVKETPPNYFYIINGERKHRYNYRKDQLPSKLTTFDIDKSEYENMVMNGYWRVWDCGSIKYQQINTENGIKDESIV